MNEAGVMSIRDLEGALINREVEQLTTEQAQAIRAAAKSLRGRRFRMLVRCDDCFEAGVPDGMRGEITREHIELECRCRFLRYHGATL